VCSQCETRAKVEFEGEQPAAERKELLAKAMRCPKCGAIDADARKALGGGAAGVMMVVGVLIGAAAGGASILLVPWFVAVGVGVVVAIVLAVLAKLLFSGPDVESELARVRLKNAWKPATHIDMGHIIAEHDGALKPESGKVFESLFAVAETPLGIFAAGHGGIAIRGPKGWVLEQTTSERLKAVGAGPDAVYAAGAYVIMRRGADGVWKRDVPRGHEGSHDVVYSEGGNIWVAGWFGKVLRRKGPLTWEEEETGIKGRIVSMHGSGATVWAVSDRGDVIVRKEGAWKKELVPADGRFNAVWCDGPDMVWIVGDSGLALRKNGGRWDRVSLPVERKSHLHTIFRAGDDLIAAGDHGVIVRIDAAGNGAIVPGDEAMTIHAGCATGEGTIFFVGERQWRREQLG